MVRHALTDPLTRLGAPVQRYRAVNAAAYNTTPDVNEPQAMFTHQSPQASLRDVGDPLTQYPGYSFVQKAPEAPPDLNAADDDTVAVQNEAEPKEFYATQGVVDQANLALTTAGSKFVLRRKGHTLTLGDHTLSMVSPDLAEPDPRAGDGVFGKYYTSVCRDFTTKVIGSSTAAHEAIFQSATGPGVANDQEAPRRRQIDTASGTGSSSVRNITGALTTAPSGPGALEGAFERDDVPEDNIDVGRDYGNALRGGQLQNKARNLGVNEFAAPEVGEGFATYTNNADRDVNDDILDFSAGMGGVPRANIWGYHFAGVVAKSADGNDRITLENYNRGDSIDGLLQGVLDQLLLDHQDLVQQAILRMEQQFDLGQQEVPPNERLALPLAARIAAAYKAVHVALNESEAELPQKQQEANEAYGRLCASRNDSQAWFFQIYGVNAGQTFHERMAATGAFANPLTLRVGKVSENVTVQRNNLGLRLNAVPDLVGGATELPIYGQVRQSGLRQMSARTTAVDLVSVYNQTLNHLARMRVQALVTRASELAAQAGVDNLEGFGFDAFAPLQQGLQQKRQPLGFFDFAEKNRLDGLIQDVGTLRARALLVNQYELAQRA